MNSQSGASIRTYFKREKKLLTLTAITGMIYNVGMTAGPWFEGQLAQYLFDILRGIRTGRDIIRLSLIYVIVIAAVQGARALKRLYVRKFANNVTRDMKESIYHHLICESYADAQKEDTGAVMTKAIADAEACAEGMRKFTTEIFDTGVVMIAYLVMLLVLDWRLTLLVILFPPIAYAASAALKGKVTQSASESKVAMSQLNDAAVDLVSNALTYRTYGEDENRSAAYEDVLQNYEDKNVAAGIWQNSPQPVYLVISMIGVIPILFLGGRNVMGIGWKVWSIASFSSFLSCFTKLATKSSHAAKLFNAVQKARVSWDRIKMYLDDPSDEKADTIGGAQKAADPAELSMEHAGFSYGDGAFALHDLNFTAAPGDIVGVTGRVACGKSTFGKMFLCEYPHEGKILYGGQEIAGADRTIFAYMGHDPELFTGTVCENITFSESGSLEKEEAGRLKDVLQIVQIDKEVTPDTTVGMEGSGLSGGQRARIALARALYSQAPVLILDDPFSAVDTQTELKIFSALREREKRRIIVLISHRMECFPQMDKILFVENGTVEEGTHARMMRNARYASLYALQCRGGERHE